jgi:acetolactate synthase-1/2/3 large subunit
MTQDILHLVDRNSTLSVADCIERVLVEQGVRFLATIPGGPLMPLLRSVHFRQHIHPVLARQETGAVLLAEGYARATRCLPAVAVTAGPGVTNATTGIALAHVEHTPMVIISAQVATGWYGRGAAQELDTVRLLEPITKASLALTEPTRAQSTLEYLLRVAQAGRAGPVHLSVASNLWNQPCRYTSRNGYNLTNSAAEPASDALLHVLTEARAPCILAGRGVVLADAHSELLALAERYPKLRVASSPRAKGVFPESHPQSLGVFGFAGHPGAEQALLDESDIVIVLGSRLGEITSLGWDERFTQRCLVQIDLDPAEIGKNFSVALGIACDIRRVLRAALATKAPGERSTVEGGTGGTGEACVQASDQDSRDALAMGEEQRARATGGLSPELLMRGLNRVLDGSEHVFVDIGNVMAWALHHLERDGPNRFHVNLMFGCMGHALPAATGAALGTRSPTIALVGDAAFAMSGFELHTAVEQGAPIVVVVLNDGGHGMVEMGSEWQFGRDAVPSARFSHRIDACALAVSLGASAAEITNETEFERALLAALRSGTPWLLDVRIDPRAVPPFGARMDLLKKNFTDSEVR